MPKIKNSFVRSIMNKDTDKAYIPNGQTGHVENLRFDINDGNDGIGKNIKGTTLVSDETNSNSDFKCVGAYFNEDKNTIYYFIATADAQLSKVIEYDVVNDQTVVALHDTTGVLSLNKEGYITGINEINGLLYWAEWGANPRRINVERAKTYGVDGYSEEDITVICKPPIQKLLIDLNNVYTTSEEKNNIEDVMLAFSYRFRYLDGEYSTLAPFTNFAFAARDFDYDFAEQSNPSMLNKFTEVDLIFYTGTERVTEIQLVWKDSESNTAYVIDDFNKDKLGYADDDKITFTFDNSKTYRALPKEVLRSFFDSVPITAMAQAMIDGRLMYSNYKEGYDLVDRFNNDLEIEYTVEILEKDNTADVSGETVPSLVPVETVKSNIDYEVGIQYLDEFGRGTTILTSKNNTIHVPAKNSITENRLKVVLTSLPPKWARYYRFFVKPNKKHYEQLVVTNFYDDGVYRWIKLEGADKDKVNEGDRLIVKSDLSGPVPTLVKTKVLELKTQEADFVDGTGVSTNREAGLYMKIRDLGFNMDYNENDLITRNDYQSDHQPPEINIIVSQIEVKFGARIRLFIESWEKDKNDNYWSFEETYVAQADYADFKTWYDTEVVDLGQFEIDNVNVSFTSSDTVYTVLSQEGGYGVSGTRKLLGEFSIQNAGIVVFETEPKRESEDLFYEIGRTYRTVVSANLAFSHSALTSLYETDLSEFPEDISQDVANDLTVILDWFNAFSYGNGIESYKVRDEFGAKGLASGVRSLTNIKDAYQEIHREAGITWSDVYNEETNFNGLSTFNLSLLNFIDLDKEEGSIQKIHNMNGNLLVLQEDAVGVIPYNKNIIQDVQNGKVVGIATNILDRRSYNPYDSGKYGISKNPESFVQDGFRYYFTDEQRGALIRLSRDGITTIDETFMDHFFSEKMLLNKGLKMVAGFDPVKKEYLLHLPSEQMTLAHKEKSKGFPNFFTFEPDFILKANNQCFAWKNGKMYKLNSNEIRNNFFDVQYDSKIKFYANQEPNVEKIAKAIALQSSHPWDVDITTDLTSRTIEKDCFVKKEDYWYSEVMGNTNGNIGQSAVFGLGSFTITNGEILTDIRPSAMCIGDSIISKTLPFAPNKITDITDDRIVLENNITEASSFLMYSKNQNIDGSNIRGDIFEIEMTNDSIEEVKLRSVGLEVSKSFYS